VVRTVVLRRALLADSPVVHTVQGAGSARVDRITVQSFDPGAGRQVRTALAAQRAARGRGVLLDLRGDPGGRLDEAVETASAFLAGGPVVSYVRRGAPPRRLDAVGSGDTVTPLVVLVDGGTASAAEVVAGALQDRGRAVLVGTRTYGKGSVQEPRPLTGGAALELTVARWTTPDGRSVDGTGLVPDIEVAAGLAPEVAVQRATEVLTGLRAGAGGRG
jgi:carboxyl-terminal processing protease